MNRKRKFLDEFVHVLERLSSNEAISPRELKFILKRQKTWCSYSMLEMAKLLDKSGKDNKQTYQNILINYCHRFDYHAFFWLYEKWKSIPMLISIVKRDGIQSSGIIRSSVLDNDFFIYKIEKLYESEDNSEKNLAELILSQYIIRIATPLFQLKKLPAYVIILILEKILKFHTIIAKYVLIVSKWLNKRNSNIHNKPKSIE